MAAIKEMLLSRLRFSTPILKVYTPLWLTACLFLVALDLATKKLVTNNLNFHLGYHQSKWIPNTTHDTLLNSLANNPEADGRDQIDILGPAGKYIKFRLVFNDRFVFGLGPSAPLLGFFLSLSAICFLLLYRWRNSQLGHPLAWLLVFSGAFGNLIDKLFIKSLTNRDWIFSLGPQKGYVSGVVDFVECIWFGWSSLSDYFLLSILAMKTWPTFNLADSMIVTGIGLLLFTMGKSKPASKQV